MTDPVKVLEELEDQFFDFMWVESPIGIAKISREWKWVQVNPRLCEMLEYTESELKGKTLKDITVPSDIDDDLEMANRCLLGEIEGYTMTKRFITKTGTVLWAKVRMTAIKHDEGEGVVAFFIKHVVPSCEVSNHVAVNPSPPNLSLWKTFLKQNWKFILMTLCSALYASYEIYHNYQSLRETVFSQTETLRSLVKQIDILTESIEQIRKQ